jgi:hypothetical protein
MSRIFGAFQNIAALWLIFSTNKSAPANMKKGFYTNRDVNKQEVGFIVDFCIQRYHSHADPIWRTLSLKFPTLQKEYAE